MVKFENQDAVEASDDKPKQHPDRVGGREWGPFYNLEHVTTEFGEYGVPRGKVLYFLLEDVVNRETMRIERVPVSKYRDATVSEQEQADKMWKDLIEANTR